MGEKIGASVQLDTVPLKYAGLRYDEIWISEAQERMVLAVPQEKVKQLLDLAASEDVEATVIGQFGTDNAELVLHYGKTEVGRISMDFLHNGIPKRRTKAVATVRNTVGWAYSPTVDASHPMVGEYAHPTRTRLLSTLAHPNIASKHWVIRQYDHEVQGGSVVKPLIGPMQVGPSDAAVIRPKLNSHKGVALGCGMAPHVPDPYDMTIASIDEAVRNVIAVGADPLEIAILDNFCWPSVDDEKTMGALARTCEACYDAAKAYGIPFISGKDSLHNQFTNQETGEVIRIPNTLLISAIAVLEDVRKCVTMDLKKPGNTVNLITPLPGQSSLKHLAALHRAVAHAISKGLVATCHDISDGGALVAAAEMCIASGLGLTIEDELAEPFSEDLATYWIETPGESAQRDLERLLAGIAQVVPMAQVTADPRLIIPGGNLNVSTEEMTKAWRGTLDW
jgi:phosphoribosylformylglycinamidine synthase